MTTFDKLDKTTPKYLQLQLLAKTNYDNTEDEYYEVTSRTPNFYWYNAINQNMLPAARGTLASTLGTVSHALVEILATKRSANVGTLLSNGTLPVQAEVAFAVMRHLKHIHFDVIQRDISVPVTNTVFGVQLYGDLFLRDSDGTNVVCEIKTSWQPATTSAPVESETGRTHREQAIMGALGMGDGWGALGVVVEINPVEIIRSIRVKSIYYSPETVQRLSATLEM